MIEALISSKTRIKLLLKFFLNGNTKSYLRQLAEEFNESTNSIRIELNRFENAGMLEGVFEGNKKFFRANKKHPLFKDLQNIIHKHIGLDKIISNIVDKLGNLKKVYLTGNFVEGKDAISIDFLFVGEIDEIYLNELIIKCEKLIKRKINVEQMSEEESISEDIENNPNYLLCWNQ